MNYQLKKTEFVIEGRGRNGLDNRDRLWVNGVELQPEESQKIRNHSLDGFSWGYRGSGPAQAALAICLHIFEDQRLAVALYQAFKETFVAQWRPVGEDFHVRINITDFLIENRDLIQQQED